MEEKHRDGVRYASQFRQQWLDEVCKRLLIEIGSPEYHRIEQVYEQKVKKTKLNVLNSFNYEEFQFPSDGFWMEAPKKFVLNENGVLFLQKHILESVLAVFNAQGIELRQIFKKMKNEYFAKGDTINYDFYAAVEYCRKVVINGLYGLSGFYLGAFFNIDCADTTTTAGRNVIAISNLTNEMQNGGYRPYVIDAYIKLIQVSKQQAEHLVGRFTLPEVSMDQVLHQILLYQYPQYPYLSFLRETLEKCTPWERSVIYLKNNMKEFFRIPEVKEKIYRWIDYNRTDPMVDKKPSKFPYSDLVDDIRKDFIDLVFGFFYYEGDYVDGIRCETVVDIFTEIQRKVTVGGDTDSGIATVMYAVDDFLEIYGDFLGELKDDYLFINGAVPVLFSEFISWSSRKVLWDYCGNLGVADQDIPRIDLECEHVMEQLHPTILKKNYVMRDVLKDYMIDKKHKIKYTGLKFIKSDANKGMGELAEKMIKQEIFPNMKDFNFASMVWNIHQTTQDAIQMLRDDSFILEKKTILKVKEDASFGDARMKCVRLWNRFFPNDSIEVPGSFGVVPIQFRKDMLEEIHKNHPDWWDILVEHCTELQYFKILNTVATRCKGLLGQEAEESETKEDLESEEEETTVTQTTLEKFLPMIHQLSVDGKQYLRELCTLIRKKHDAKVYDIELYHQVESILQLFRTEDRAWILKIIPFKPVVLDPWKDIPKLIDRIAVPVDINTIPELLQMTGIRDIRGACEFEQLIGPLVNTCSVRVPRNKERNAVVTSMLKTF